MLTFESPMLNARLRGVPIDVGGKLWRRRSMIDDSPPTSSDHLDLDSIGPDESVQLVKAWAPKVAIKVLSRGGGHLCERQRRGVSENQ